MTDVATPARRAPVRTRLAHYVVAAVPVATVGPNLGSQGLRAEHVFALIAPVLLLLAGRGPRHSPVFLGVCFAWVTTILIAVVGGFIPLHSSDVSPDRGVVGGAARLIVPLLGLIVGAFVARLDDADGARPVLDAMFAAIIAVACLNAAVAALSAITDLSWLTSWFLPTDATTSVSARAIQAGRYGGVMNQPVEAGMLYSVALLTAVRQWVNHRLRSVLFVLAAVAIVIGGALVVSKAFFLGGLPIALVYLAVARRDVMRQFGVVALTATASIGTVLLALPVVSAKGAQRLDQLAGFWQRDNATATLTAGRLDPSGSTLAQFSSIIDQSGLFGLGARGGRWPYDIGVMEFVATSGLVGVACMTAIVVCLLWTSASRRDWYWVMLTVYVIGANLGGPAFTANRNALVIWTLFGVMLVSRADRREPRSP